MIYNDLNQDFGIQCVSMLKNQQNPWYDPIDPTTNISVKELCDLHKKLFDSLQEKQQNTLAEAVSFSYITTLDLYLKASEQNDI